MAKKVKQTNIWVYVIIALIVGGLIGYAAAGGFSTGGKATSVGLKCPFGSEPVCESGLCHCIYQGSAAGGS